MVSWVRDLGRNLLGNFLLLVALTRSLGGMHLGTVLVQRILHSGPVPWQGKLKAKFSWVLFGLSPCPYGLQDSSPGGLSSMVVSGSSDFLHGNPGFPEAMQKLPVLLKATHGTGRVSLLPNSVGQSSDGPTQIQGEVL